MASSHERSTYFRILAQSNKPFMAVKKTWFNRYQTKQDIKIRKFCETLVKRELLASCHVDRAGLTCARRSSTDAPRPIKSTDDLLGFFIDDQEKYKITEDVIAGIITGPVKKKLVKPPQDAHQGSEQISESMDTLDISSTNK